MADFVHPDWVRYKRTGRKRRGDALGGNMVSVKEVVNMASITCKATNGYAPTAPLYSFLEGEVTPISATGYGIWTNPTSTPYGPVAGQYSGLPTQLHLDPLGATAISRCSPTNPHAGLATAIGELKKEGLPDLRLATGRERGYTHAAAENNLKIQFEALPLISDATDLYHAVRDHGKILRQYARDSGRDVRRTYRFPTDVSTTLVEDKQDLSVLPYPWKSDLRNGNFRRTIRRTTTTNTWFVGSFTYARASGDTGLSKAIQKYQDLNHLLGTGLGPSTVWNLTGWSWLIDYFTNVGDVLANAQMFMIDGLIMRYGYVMQTVEEVTEYALHNTQVATPYLRSGALRLPNPWVATRTLTKSFRRGANPFGFGITHDGLSFRQMSILASLGITRSARTP